MFKTSLWYWEENRLEGGESGTAHTNKEAIAGLRRDKILTWEGEKVERFQVYCIERIYKSAENWHFGVREREEQDDSMASGLNKSLDDIYAKWEKMGYY